MYQALDNHFIYLCSSKWSVSSLYGLKADNGIIYVSPRISRISQICWLTFLSSNVRVSVSPGSWQPAGDYYHLSTLMIVRRFPVSTPGAMSESRWHCLLIGFCNSDCLEHCVAWVVLPPNRPNQPGVWKTLSSNPPLSGVPVVFICNVCTGQDNQNLPGHNLYKLETTPSPTTTKTE